MSEQLRELTSEEKAKPYSKYYRLGLSAPDPELLERLQSDRPLDPDQVLMPENLNDLLKPGHLEGETGWCVLPNGAGYVAVNNKMPGVTADMVNWWMWWHSLENLRYKIWWPKAHLGISVPDPKQRVRVADPDPEISHTARWQGITHNPIEDVGMGPESIFIYFMTPEQFGFDMSRFVAPNVATAVCANGASGPLEDTSPFHPKAPAMMCHFIREIPGGIEYRTRFWMGYQVVEKRPVCILPPGAKVPWQAALGLGRHNVEEYSNLRVLLPLIYEEENNRHRLV